VETTPTEQPDPAPEKLGYAPLRALAHVTMAVAIAAAGIGYLVGLRAGVPTDTGHAGGDVNPARVAHDAPAAVSYAQMPNNTLGPNAGWASKIPPRDANHAALFAAFPDDPALRSEALRGRAQRRAYDGAPPVVPHAIDQTNSTACLACHEHGLRIGTVVAPRMSHELLGNCTQCHVEAGSSAMASAGPPLGDNLFVGQAAPGRGGRAWQGAPPTIPHTTWMRQNCASCHGTLNDAGLRTSHPWRTNCTQCHAPSAELDQRVILDADRPPVVEFITEGTP